jgi:hypothetical protein
VVAVEPGIQEPYQRRVEMVDNSSRTCFLSLATGLRGRITRLVRVLVVAVAIQTMQAQAKPVETAEPTALVVAAVVLATRLPAAARAAMERKALRS